MKFVQGRRSQQQQQHHNQRGTQSSTTCNTTNNNTNNNNCDGVLRFKTLMTGKQTMVPTVLVDGGVEQSNENPRQPTTTPTKTSQRSTKVLVNKSCNQGTSLEFTTLDTTEAASVTSFSSGGADSFAVLEIDDANNDDDLSSIGNDPYLCDKRRRGQHRQEQAASKDVWFHQMNHQNTTTKHTSITLNKKSSPVITLKSLSTGQFFDCDSKEGRTQLTTPDTVDESNPADEDHNNTYTKAAAKLTSLGTFDFPSSAVADSPSSGVQVKSNIKSLGGGSFEIPVAGENSSSPPVKNSSFSSPLSAIGKGLKALGTLALPRALHFELVARQQPPPTPVSQAGGSCEEEEMSPRMARHLMEANKECDFWNSVVTRFINTHGKVHAKTAEALLQLGYAYMLAREYAQAVIAFQSACRIWKQLQQSQNDQLALARVVDAIGMAWARVSQDEDRDHCHKAMTALEEAFQIRYDLLGPWHIDTVETLNKIASVHLHLREYGEACNAYWEVFWVRKAIFGSDHPSVAIGAHALGNVLVKLAATEDAAKFFQIAVDIYDKMQLPTKHPAVIRLMRDYKRLDRISLACRHNVTVRYHR